MPKVWFRLVCIFFFCAGTFSQKVYTQTGGISQDQLRTLAYQAYSGAKYSEAAKYFSNLLDRFPRDPKYHYFTAVSLIQSRTDIPRAIGLLDFPALSLQFPDAGLRKAEAFILLYRFDEAENLLHQLSDNRDADREIRASAANWIQMIGEARKQVGKIRDVGLYAKSFQDFEKGLILSGTDTLLYAPLLDPVFLRLNNLYPDSLSRIVNPGSVKIGEDACFVSRSSKKSDLNIYHVKRTGARSWSTPEKLGPVINSAEDETFAWFDNADSTLFFISYQKGSMGGADIFISHLSSNGTWSPPQNPGFPINSVAGERAIILQKDHHTALVVSDRQTMNDVPGSFLISWPPEPGNHSENNPDSLLALSFFPENRFFRQTVENRADNQLKGIKPEKIKGEYTKQQSENLMSANDDQDYMTLLNDALRLQLKADSLFREAERARAQLTSTSNPTVRQQLQQVIRKCSSDADKLQGDANVMYSRAREMELRYLQQVYPERERKAAKNSSNVDNQSVTFQEKGGNKKPDTRQLAEKKDSIAGQGKGTEGLSQDTRTTSKKSKDQFAILASCPYNEKNPIPPVVNAGKGVVYRIQLGVFSKPVAIDKFQGISPLFFEKLPENGLTKYYAGEFETIIAAEKALTKVKDTGFREAFIISYFQGNKISLIRARELEQMIHAQEANP